MNETEITYETWYTDFDGHRVWFVGRDPNGRPVFYSDGILVTESTRYMNYLRPIETKEW